MNDSEIYFAFFLFSLVLSKESYFLVSYQYIRSFIYLIIFFTGNSIAWKIGKFFLVFLPAVFAETSWFQRFTAYFQKQSPRDSCLETVAQISKLFWKVLWNLQENVFSGISLPAQVLPVSFAKYFRTGFFLEHLWTAASKLPVNLWSHSFPKRSPIRKLHKFCQYFAGKWKVLKLNYSVRVNNQKT